MNYKFNLGYQRWSHNFKYLWCYLEAIAKYPDSWPTWPSKHYVPPLHPPYKAPQVSNQLTLLKGVVLPKDYTSDTLCKAWVNTQSTKSVESMPT